MKQEVLKLNKGFAPLGTSNWKSIFVDIVAGAAYPVDVSYYQDKHGDTDLSKVESLQVIKTFEEWAELPIRPYDEYVNSPSKRFRIPPIVVCANFDKIIHKKVLFPTKNNIWKRDNFQCCYSGEKLTKDTISTDHVIPKSRGGDNSWGNLVSCRKDINVFKADRTPQEAGLKMLYKPYKPENGMVYNTIREEWNIFLDVEKYK